MALTHLFLHVYLSGGMWVHLPHLFDSYSYEIAPKDFTYKTGDQFIKYNVVDSITTTPPPLATP